MEKSNHPHHVVAAFAVIAIGTSFLCGLQHFCYI